MFRYIELFAGIGGFRQALDRLDGKCVFASEIDAYAQKSYTAIYGDRHLYGDITEIDAMEIPDHDLLVGGFPCQAFSVAGKQKGFEDTRGTLFFEIARIARFKKPRLMLLENVKNLLSHDKGATFELMCSVLNDIGYGVDVAVLNSKFFGVPQNRERVIIVCSRDAEYIEWEPVGNSVLAKTKRRLQAGFVRSFNFEWPTNDTVTTRLRDVLESNVDEKYYLSEEKTAKLVAQLDGMDYTEPFIMDGKNAFGKKHKVFADGIAPTCLANDYKEPKRVVEPMMIGHIEVKGHDLLKRVYSVDGISPTVTSISGGGHEPKIAEPIMVGRLEQDGHESKIVEAVVNDRGYLKTNDDGVSNAIDANYKNGLDNHGQGTHVLEYSRRDGIGKELDVAHTLNSSDWQGLNRNQKQNAVLEVRPVLTPDRPEKRQNGRRFKEDGEESFTLTGQDRHGVAIGWYPRYRIRKLTPLECWRLQGFSDKVFFTVRAAGVSDSQLYKQAGNTVTIHKILAVGEKLLPLMESGGLNENDL